MTNMWEATVEVRSPACLGEGPWWDGERKRLLWVDIPTGTIYAHTPATETIVTSQVPDPVGFVVGRRGGGYLAGTATGIVALDDALRVTGTVAAPPDLAGGRRINDGVCDPAGRVLFGTVDPSALTPGTLWSLSPDGSLVALLEGVVMSNGLAFSPDAQLLYYVDTATQEVHSFDYDVVTGTVSGRRVLYRIAESMGLPDGLAVDASGCVWVAIWGAGAVWRLSPEGCRTGVVCVPTANTSNCAFGGAKRRLLYITAARTGSAGKNGMDDAAGTVFVADVGTTGAEVWSAFASSAARPSDAAAPVSSDEGR